MENPIENFHFSPSFVSVKATLTTEILRGFGSRNFQGIDAYVKYNQAAITHIRLRTKSISNWLLMLTSSAS